MVDGPVVAVRGEAYREVAPEIARFAATAMARDKDREVTLTRLAERAAAVRVLLDGYGPAVDRRETGDLRVRPELKRSGERVVAYHGSVTTTVTMTDFALLGEVMMRLADQDQIEVAGPWWSLRPDSPVHRDARHAAIADALQRAGVRRGARCPVTALLELSDTGTANQPVMFRAAAASAGPGRRGTRDHSTRSSRPSRPVSRRGSRSAAGPGLMPASPVPAQVRTVDELWPGRTSWPRRSATVARHRRRPRRRQVQPGRADRRRVGPAARLVPMDGFHLAWPSCAGWAGPNASAVDTSTPTAMCRCCAGCVGWNRPRCTRQPSIGTSRSRSPARSRCCPRCGWW
jgi:uncharacterized protein YggE